jgi:hypothetical protein
MFEGWGEFFLMAGGAAAVLIGLIFVVVTLLHDRSRSSVLAGSKLYMGPVLLQVSFVLVLSAAALTVGMTPAAMALLCGAIAAWGLVRAVRSTVGIRALTGEDKASADDPWFYGVLPAALYVALAVVAFGFLGGREWAIHGLAAVTVALLCNAIRNEWDLVTWIAPRADEKKPEP